MYIFMHLFQLLIFINVVRQEIARRFTIKLSNVLIPAAQLVQIAMALQIKSTNPVQYHFDVSFAFIHL